ncbi:unnamed protein product [Ostreobium quekettii]|uniref:Sec1-like protein n=1 Tax=Ostreobium quekettii TaxID=121088 RepID=A0A8S1JHU6_9CHLO|nr:unnamed protein product [Ostreobium quekettii]|eukprot:evm.model.scf_2430EXC.3 EVM.evm.TU.scf_2430EXC.3   scf_2430EXC:7969-11357(+)
MTAKPQARVPPLVAGPVPLRDIRDWARSRLVDIVDSMVGAKAIIFDPEIAGTLGLIIPGAVLAEHGVEQMFILGENIDEPKARNIMYLARANILNAQRIATQIKAYTRLRHPHEYFVSFIPRCTCLCEKIIEEEGVKGDATLIEYPLEFVPFDDDVISLELEHSFRETSVEGDTTSLYIMARALAHLQSSFGPIPRVTGKGAAAEAVKNIFMKARIEMGLKDTEEGKIKRLILIDRAVDLITPLVTQVTYEGIVDEMLGIKNNVVTVEVATRAGPSEPKKYVLNSADSLHAEMRDVPWPHAAPRIREWAQKMKSDWRELNEDASSKTVSEIRDFTNRLMQLNLAEMHSNISDPVMKVVPTSKFQSRLQIERQVIEYGSLEEGCRHVEDLLFRGGDMMQILRLMCLLSVTNNGLPKKSCDNLRRAFLLTFGYENLVLLNHLESAGMLTLRAENRNPFPSIRKAFSLAIDIDAETGGDTGASAVAKDIGYIYWGYAPLSVRIVELALKQPRPKPASKETDSSQSTPSAPWRGRGADGLSLLPGPHFDVALGEHSQHGGERSKGPIGREGPEVVMVAFLGGVTFSEISALRFLSRLPNSNVKFLIATTRILNGNSLLQTFQEQKVDDLMKRARGML